MKGDTATVSNTFIPAVTIRKGFTCAYEVWDGHRRYKQKQPSSNKSTGRLSSKAAQRLAVCVELLTSAAQTKRLWWSEEKRYVSFKLSFVTLTLPSKQVHTDNEIVTQVLKPFIRWWRDKNPALLYIWKAEVQDNGNIHFHLTTNSFIHWRTLRKKWNQCVNKLGYIDRYGKDNPNSTDVHSVKNIRDLSSYLTAYVTKKDLYTKRLKRWHRRYDKHLKASKEPVFHLPRNYFSNIKREVKCKLWDASKDLLAGPCRVYMPDNDIRRDLWILNTHIKPAVNLERCKVYNYRDQGIQVAPALQKAYNDHIAELRQRCKQSSHIMK